MSVCVIIVIMRSRQQTTKVLISLHGCVGLHAPLFYEQDIDSFFFLSFRGFLIIGAVWILFNLGMQALYEWAFDFPKLAFFRSTG